MSALMPAQLVSQDAELTQLKLELSCVTDNPQYVYLITASLFYSHVLLFTYCCSVCYWLTTAVTLTSHMHTLHTNFLFCFNTLWNRQHIVILWTSNMAQATQRQSSSTKCILTKEVGTTDKFWSNIFHILTERWMIENNSW